VQIEALFTDAPTGSYDARASVEIRESEEYQRPEGRE
jgi:hypothetical protein